MVGSNILRLVHSSDQMFFWKLSFLICCIYLDPKSRAFLISVPHIASHVRFFLLAILLFFFFFFKSLLRPYLPKSSARHVTSLFHSTALLTVPRNFLKAEGYFLLPTTLLNKCSAVEYFLHSFSCYDHLYAFPSLGLKKSAPTISNLHNGAYQSVKKPFNISSDLSFTTSIHLLFGLSFFLEMPSICIEKLLLFGAIAGLHRISPNHLKRVSPSSMQHIMNLSKNILLMKENGIISDLYL